MMDDIYLEYMLKKKKTTTQKVLSALLLVVAGVLSLALLMLLYLVCVVLQQAMTGLGEIVITVGLLLIAGMWYGIYLIVGMQNVEYEYILTNSEMDIDKIMSKRGRKSVASFDFKEVIVCANVNDNDHNHDYKNVTPEKVFDAVGDKDSDNIYFVDFNGENGRIRVLFQPTSKLINSAKRFNPRNIFVMED